MSVWDLRGERGSGGEEEDQEGEGERLWEVEDGIICNINKETNTV